MFDMTAMRALVREINFSTHGVPATVTRPEPNDTAIETTVIWLTPFTEDSLSGMSANRREARKQVAIRLDDVPTVPRGTLIEAAPPFGGAVQRWRVEGPDRIEGDHGRYTVIFDPDPYDVDPEL